MKKLIMIAVVLLSVSAITAQKSTNNNARKEVEKYLDENIVPELIIQQQYFLMYLTEEEKAKVDEVKDQMNQMHKKQEGKNGNGQGRKSGKHQGKRSEGSDERGQEMRKQFEAVKEELTQISDAHPKAVNNYQQFIESNKEHWFNDLDEILKENGVDREDAKQRNAGPHGKMIDRLSDPVWLMLWNPEDPIIRKRMSHHMKHRKGGEFNEELRTEKRNYDDKKDFDYLRKDDNFSLSMFPNPANVNATIEIRNANSMELSVALYSKEGEKIKTLYSGLNENSVLNLSFEISNLENGIYFVKAWSDEHKLTEKLIVSH